MPRYRALLEFADQSLLQFTPAIFSALIDERADSQNHANHLVITSSERQALISQIDSEFGDALDGAHANALVSSASVLKSYLVNSGYRSSDEPWE